MADQQRPPLDELFHRLNKHDAEWLNDTLNKRWDYLVQESTSTAMTDVALGISQQTELWTFDLTMPHLPKGHQVSKFIQELRARDWAATELGAMATWSTDVRRMVNLLLHNEQPAALWFGPNHLLVYNEAYTTIIGTRHPLALGRPYIEVWPEIDPAILAVLNACQRSGEHFQAEDALHIIESNGRREELWVTLTLTPLPETVTGGILGTYASFHFNTDRVLLSRRMSTLLKLGHATARAQDSQDFWKQVSYGLESSPNDILFAAVYCFTRAHTGRSNSSRGASGETGFIQDWRCVLTGTTGLAGQSAVLPTILDPDTASELFTPAFHTTLSTGNILVLDDDTFPSVLSGAVRSSVTGDLCTAGVVFPISPANCEDIHGFVLLGLNPLVPYCSNYREFVDLLQHQCATSLASVVLMEEEKRRSRFAAEAAAHDRIILANQLAETQQEIIEERSKFASMADRSPLAMFQIDEEGHILYANQMWRAITQLAPDDWMGMAWTEMVHPDDSEMVTAQLGTLLRGESVNFEMRWRGDYSGLQEAYINGEQVLGPTWTIVSAYADLRPDGSIKTALGCLTDITQQKWIKDYHERRVNEVLELKRSQESFMDMICHEARNPLSAMMLCTETILATMRDLVISGEADQVMMSGAMVQQQLAAAENMMACAEHQKRIIDDVLTLSKLDSELLVLCPVETRPIEVITQALQMFDVEMKQHGIQTTFLIDLTYHNLQLEWLWLDSSRLLQVLINLVTNAIKFTKGQPEKQIQITLSASLTRPVSSMSGVRYDAHAQLLQATTAEAAQEDKKLSQSFSHQLFDGVSQKTTTSVHVSDVGASPATPEGDSVFLAIDVMDSGAGIKPHEMLHLFQKFQQASPKTHVEYGGSGLGLFISRQLTKMLGGAIGAASGAVNGRPGSTFAFYIEAHRSARSEQLSIDGQLGMIPSPDVVEPMVSTPLLPEADKEDIPQIQHVLVVEDNLVNQKILRNQLERLGYQVAVANHGIEALDYILKSHYCQPNSGVGVDVVLLDIEMPVCNGLECARRIRRLQEDGHIHGHVPIIAVTANARSEQQALALEAGMDTVLTKPFRVAQLSEILRSIGNRFCSGKEKHKTSTAVPLEQG